MDFDSNPRFLRPGIRTDHPDTLGEKVRLYCTGTTTLVILLLTKEVYQDLKNYYRDITTSPSCCQISHMKTTDLKGEHVTTTCTIMEIHALK